MIHSKDISVVLQGPVREETAVSILKCRSLLPDAEIILATWKGEHVEQIVGADKVIEIEDIPLAFIQHKRLGVKNNLNRLIRSTKIGIKSASRSYILKMRSDLILDSKNFLEAFETYSAKGRKTVLKHKVVIPLLFSRRAYRGNMTPFHLSDWAAFGLSEDIKDIFLKTQEVPEPEFTEYFSSSKTSPFGSTTFRMSPEQWLFHSFFSRHYLKVMNDATDCNESIVTLSDEFIVSNFIVADYNSTGFRLPKYSASIDEVSIGSEYLDLWNALHYERKYRKFCDPHFQISQPTIERLYRHKKTFECRLRLKKHIIRLSSGDGALETITEAVVVLVTFVKLIFFTILKK